MLSAAQPQPNGHSEINVSVPGLALGRAALNGATSSPNGEMRLRSVAEQFERKDNEGSAALRFPRRSSNNYTAKAAV